MRIVLDPGQGGRDPSSVQEAAANLRVAVSTAVALRLATSDLVDVAITRRDGAKVSYDEGRAMMDGATVVVRIEHRADVPLVIVGNKATPEALDVATRLGGGRRPRVDSGRDLLRENPALVLYSPGCKAASATLVSALAGFVAASLVPR